MANYRYDLFISYKTHPEWNSWTRNHIYGMLKAYLSDQLPQDPRIFIDDHTQVGEDWVQRIGTALGRSRALLAILSVPYFSSKWCLHELDLMHKRFLGIPGNEILIFPINVSGKGSLNIMPMEIERLQICELTKFRNLDIQRGTPAYHKFSTRIKRLSNEIAQAINHAPPFNMDWEEDCMMRFNDVFQARHQDSEIPVETLSLKLQPWSPRQTTFPKVFP
jgi:hypothetical protein